MMIILYITNRSPGGINLSLKGIPGWTSRAIGAGSSAKLRVSDDQLVSILDFLERTVEKGRISVELSPSMAEKQKIFLNSLNSPLFKTNETEESASSVINKGIVMTLDEVKSEIVKFCNADNKILTEIGFILVGRKIGEGGNGIVFSGTWKNREVAIKFFCFNIDVFETKFSRYKDEIVIQLFSYDSPHTAKILHFGSVQLLTGHKVPFFVMPKYEMTLKEFHKSLQTEQERVAVFKDLFSKLCIALSDIHSRGIIHRDLKPENVFLTKEKTVILGDMGIAYFDNDLERLVETKKGDRLANYLYSAPEQFQNANASVTMDIFSLAQIMQWFAHGEPHRGTHRKRISMLSQSLLEFDTLIEKMLANDPNKRFKSVDEIISSLKRVDLNEDSNIARANEMFECSRLFDEALRRTFPGRNGFFMVQDESQVDELFKNISEKQEKMELWWTWGDNGNNPISKPIVKEGLHWIFGTFECKVKGVIIFKGPTIDREFIVLWIAKDISFWPEMSNEDVYLGRITAAKFNGGYIKASEHDDGFARIDNKTVEVGGQSEIRERFVEESFMFIAPNSNTVMCSENDFKITEILKSLRTSEDKLTSLEETRFFARNRFLAMIS